MNARRLKKNGWTVWHLVSASVMLLAAGAVTWRGWAQIVELGLTRDVAGHVFLVPVIVAWLVWVRRKRMLYCRPSGAFPGLILACLGAAAYVYGDKRVHPSLFHLGTVLLPAGCVVAVAGREVLRSYLSAFVVLLALIPPPIAQAEAVAQPLQVATGALTTWLYSWMGSTASLDGGHLRIGSASLRLTEVCAGLPMTLSLLLLSYGFVFGTPLRMSARLAVLLLTPMAGIACSALAVVGTFWLYGGVSQERADVVLRLGEWAMLGVSFLLLIGAVRALTWASVPVRRYRLAYDQ
ncbi:MAG: exosortase/archaeosortase family protein [Planctomycetota bacterium]